MPIAVHRYDQAADFLRRAEDWLLAREAENNLLLGIAGQMASGRHPYDEGCYLATVERENTLLGAAWHTPPHRFGLVRMPEEALGPLVADLSGLQRELSGVHGPELTARRFAELWCEPRGLRAELAMHLRIYQLDALIEPASPPPGALRSAGPADTELASEWMRRFSLDAGLGDGEFEPVIRRLIERNALYFWDDDGPRSMAGTSGPTANGIRVSMVYTPSELRGRGYAGACVAATCRRQQALGRRHCYLYADLSNPTSNALYQRIGFRAVGDEIDLDFLSAETQRP